MNSKREELAIDALLVSQLRTNRENVESLPELTNEDIQAIDSLGADFVDRLLRGEVKAREHNAVEPKDELVCGPAFGLNRAKDVDETTRQELDINRQEIIDRIKQIEEGIRNGDVE